MNTTMISADFAGSSNETNTTLDLFGGSINMTNSSTSDLFGDLSGNNTKSQIATTGKGNHTLTDWLDLVDTLFRIGSNRTNSITSVYEASYNRTGFLSVVWVFCALGIIGNVQLFFVTFQQELNHYSYSVFLALLSLNDTMTFVVKAFYLHFRPGSKEIYMTVNLNLCRTLFTLDAIPSISAWTLVCLAADRYIGVVFPLKRVSICTVFRARLVSAIIVIVCLGSSLHRTVYATAIPMGKHIICGYKPSTPNFPLYFEFIWTEAIPVCLLIGLSVRTLCAIKGAAVNN